MEYHFGGLKSKWISIVLFVVDNTTHLEDLHVYCSLQQFSGNSRKDCSSPALATEAVKAHSHVFAVSRNGNARVAVILFKNSISANGVFFEFPGLSLGINVIVSWTQRQTKSNALAV